MSSIEKIYDSDTDEEEMEEKENESDDEIDIGSDDENPTSKKENRMVEKKEEDDEDDYEDEEDNDEEDDGEENDEEEDKKENKKMVIYEEINTIEEPDDDDEEYDENYLQKFDKSIEEEIIADFHPELKSHNYDEVDILSRVVRDANGDIIDPLHRTLPFITKYEKARILGERAKQINAGAKPFVIIPENMIDGYLIALKEFQEKKIPFILKRPLPNGAMEYWKFKDLEILE